MSGPPKNPEPAPAAPEVATAEQVAKPSHEEDQKASGGPKAVVVALKAKLATVAAKIKGALPVPPKIDGPTIKAAAKAFMRDVVTLPTLIWTGDAITRIAVVGFVLSATLLIITTPQALQILLSRTPGLKNLPGLAQTAEAPEAVEAPRPAPLKTLGPVAYLGEFEGAFEGGGTFVLEVFLEFETEDEAAAARSAEEKVRKALQATMDGVNQDDWISEEGKRETLAALTAAAAEASGVKPQRVLITKEALTERESSVE